MNKKKYILIITILCFSFSLEACTSTLSKESKTLETSQIVMNSTKSHDYKTIDFNLGLQYAYDGKGNEDPYYLRGTMSIPTDMENKKLKPVIIIHGCHDNSNKKRYDIGFEYLTNFLAQNGYLAISVDVNAAYDWNFGENEEFTKIPEIVDAHIEALQAANKGDDYYGIDLKNKIDFNNMSLIGHSRGGESVFYIVEEERKKGVDINNILIIAPTNNADTDFNINIQNVSILVPGLDGDVNDLAGLSIYNKMREENKSVKILSATTIKEANHNYFNSEVKYNDSETLNTDLTNQISRYEQEKFLQQFTVDFLDVCFGKDKKNTIYDESIGTITKINDLEVLTYLSTDNRQEIVDISKLDNFKIDNVSLDIVEDCYTLNKDTASGINLPGHDDIATELLSVTWREKNSSISFKPSICDFSTYDQLSLNVLVDGLNELNKKGIPQSITVELVDKKGQSQAVEIHRNSYLLSYPDGTKQVLDIKDESRIVYWNKVTPMSNIRIPLKEYDSIDISNIKTCKIYFNELESGALMFESVSVN